MNKSNYEEPEYTGNDWVNDMNREKQIEEMAQVLPDTLPDWFDKNRKIILAKSFKTQIAREYYNAGYRKEDGYNLMLESKIKVLEATIERIDNEKAKYLESIENLTSGKCALRCPLVEMGRKETAKEIFDELMRFERKDGFSVFIWNKSAVKQIAKYYGVEIEE